MRIRLTEFEHHFASGELQKGLHLSKKKPPVLVARNHNHFGYQVTQHLVTFEKSGNELRNVHCDCHQGFCRHIAAVMFVQHGESLSAGSAKVRRNEKPSANAEKFRGAFATLESAWKKITSSPQPVSEQIAAFVKKLDSFSHKNDFATDMAVIAGMSLCGRSALTDEKLSNLTQRIILRNFAGNAVTDEESMFLCLSETLRSNDRAMTGRFSSVLPVYLLRSRNIFHLEELRSMVERRHYRKFHSDLFDELVVARTMLMFRTGELDGKIFRITKTSPPEHFVAKARLLFAAFRMEEAWQVLDELRRVMRERMPLSYFDLLSYLIALCEALHDNERKVEIAEEMMLCSPYLSSSFVAGYLAALPAGKRPERVRRMMQQVSASGADGACDKLLMLAMESGQSELFFQSPLKNKVRFALLHELFARHRSLLGSDHLEFYFRRLCESLAQTDFAHPRVQMLRIASGFLRQLPLRKAQQYHEKVLGFIYARPALRMHFSAWESALPANGRVLVLE